MLFRSTAVDDDATAAITLDAGGAADVTIGSADVTQINLITDAASATDVSITGGLTVSTTLAVTGAATFTAGAQSAAVARTATADGLTTGVIAAGTRYVTVTSDDANKIVTLPAPVVGNIITLYIGATGVEVRTVAASNVKINDVDADGTNEAALPATTLATFTAVSSTEWILEAVTELGAVITAIVPDAA